MNSILILGQANTLEVQRVYEKACQSNVRAHIVDSTLIPNSVSLDYSPNSSQCTLYLQQQAIPITSISGVYWARVEPSHTKQEMNTTLAANINYENACLLQLLFTETQLNWVNSLEAIQFHRTKPKQLALAAKLGACIPPTYVGNNHAQITDFLLLHPQSIVKPIHSGGFTRLLQANEHEMHSLCVWAKYPITLQAYIPGDNVRTYIVGDFMVTGLIKETYISTQAGQIRDYRHADEVRLIPMQLPIQIQQLAVRIMRAFHMQFTAIDWRLTSQGEFVFLEANPAPMFAHAQAQLGVEIDQAILRLLVS